MRRAAPAHSYGVLVSELRPDREREQGGERMSRISAVLLDLAGELVLSILVVSVLIAALFSYLLLRGAPL